MKIGDLVKVKDCCAYGNVYMQQIAGFVAVLLERDELGVMTILTQGKAWRVRPSDVRLYESR
jgi:hypothetical protein